MKQVLRFLHSLSLHNDKVWFEAHKNEYLTAKSTIAELAVRLIEGIRSFDDTIGPLSASDCTYRIYRDVRFSKDKSPYKTHFGLYLVPGGKKCVGGGYYFHLQPTNEDGEYSENSMIDVGVHCPPTAAAKIIRQAIFDEGQELRDAVENDEVRRYGYVFWSEEKLKVLPKQWRDSPFDDLIRMKDWDLFRDLSEEEALAPNLVERVVEGFRIGKPVNDFFNRVLDGTRVKSIF